MNKKKWIIIILAVLVVIACAVAMFAFGTPKLTKSVSVEGCEIKIPENWASDSKGNFYDNHGKDAGKLFLIKKSVNEKNVLEFYDGEVKDAQSPEKISDTLIKYTFTGEKGETILYFVPKNEATACVVFYRETVSEGLAEKIAKTLKAPEKEKEEQLKADSPVAEPDTNAEGKEDEENTEPDTPKPDESTGKDGDVVYSGTVVIYSSTLVTHPETGEQVEIGPYAEARGYGAYLNKPINCVIKRSGSGYIATASCGGSVIASYPLNSEAELNWAIGLIKAYS